jgi:hypothetical protein
MPDASETRKETREAGQDLRGKVQETTDRVADKGREAFERVADKGRESFERVANAGRDTAERVADAGKETVKTAADFGKETAKTAAETTLRIGREAGDASVMGMRALAEVQAPLTEAGYEEGRRFIERTARVTDVYREAADRTSDDLQALVAGYSRLARGWQQIQHTYFDLLRQALDRMHRRPQNFWRARSIPEMAEVQRDLFTDWLKINLTISTSLLQLGSQIAQEAVQPLKERSNRGLARA